MYIELLQDYMGHKAGAQLECDDKTFGNLCEQGIAKAINGDPLEERLSGHLEDLTSGVIKEVSEQIETLLTKFDAALKKSRKYQTPAIFGESGEGDPGKTFGAYLLAVKKGDEAALDSFGSQFVAGKDLSVGVGTGGGFTVPEQFVGRLLSVAAENGIMRKRATVIPMSGPTVKVPTLDITTAPSAGDTAFFGGLVATWNEEGADKKETEPVFKQIDLKAYELTGYTQASNTLLSDNAIGLESLLYQLFGRAIAWYEDYAFLRGNGAGKPLGVLNANALISVTRSSASSFSLEDAATMLSRLLPGGSESSIVWAIHPTVLAKLLTMTGGDSVVYIDNARAKPQMMLLGKPVEVTEKLPSLNTLGDVLLIDAAQYLIGDRQDIAIDYSAHVGFTTNTATWRFVSRVDGQPWMRDKVTLADASSTLSPFVGLAAG